MGEAKHQPADKQPEEKKSKAGRKRESKLPPNEPKEAREGKPASHNEEELSPDNRTAEEILFKNFNSFVDDAVFFINERFGAFFKEPLKSFSVFDFKGFSWPSSDADDNAEYHRFGVDAIDKIIDHFSLIFEEEEILRMKQQCLYYDPSYSLTKMFHLHSISMFK